MYVLSIYVLIFLDALIHTYLKFDMCTSLNVLEFDIRTIQSMHKKYRSTYMEVQRPCRVTWGLWGIGSSGLKLSLTLNSLGIRDNSSLVVI